ncbi:L,D-transpeptidase family protein [Ensifer sp.]|jgi:peptidoglycan hydrolase-like protein with peptidoglycan-binding domain|uniref:L,D-transpeptidase family protein n=1 Tax=Ensifer sp. TaxID=1872086 RepID=UPI002E0FE9CA|nr:L,D-transpeptidase family protein [Ensifer sp.]
MVSRFALTASFVALLLSPASGLAGSRGPLQIIVSKDQQSLVVYDGDAVIATSPVSTGKAGHTTPSGIFSILEKRRHHKSNIYSNAPMPFMQRLTWSGIALHGSNHVPDYPASHGCVRLPSAFAASLFKMTDRGVHVLISDRQMTPVEVKSALLFRPAPIEIEPPLSDVPLRPAISQAADGPVEVAMRQPDGATGATRSMEEPIRILITRSDLRDDMREVQASLEVLGYAPGTVDGHSGPATVAALRAFQASEGLESDGKLTLELTDRLLRKAGRTPPQNGKLLVRQGFKPLFEAGLTIDNPDEALGTHFLQFRHNEEAGAEGKWFGVTLENHLPSSTKKRLGISTEADPFAYNGIQRTLARLTIADDVRKQVEQLLSEGSSLSIADTDSGLETGPGTDFITITRPRPAG